MNRTMAFLLRLMGRRSCEDVVGVLQDYFEGSLDPKLAAAIERHFRDCLECRAFSRAYGDVVRLTGELEADDIPDDVRDRVREALRERASGSDR